VKLRPIWAARITITGGYSLSVQPLGVQRMV
jgi:hypothetical protein